MAPKLVSSLTVNTDMHFHRKYDLLRHIRVVHSAEIVSTEFQCKHCEKKFADAEALDLHTASQHKNLPKKSFNCEKCEALFSTKYNLDRHKVVHGNVADAVSRFDCPQCSNTFSNKANLKNHVKRCHVENEQDI